jgi:hypothetical protein
LAAEERTSMSVDLDARNEKGGRMKRLTHVTTVVALALLILGGEAQAQNMRAGINAGVDFSTLGGDIAELVGTGAKTKTGFSAGAFFGVDLSTMFRIQLNGQYVQKGAKFEESGVTVTFDVPYVEFLLPVTFLIPIENSSITPRIYVGPSLAFEMSCDVKAEFEDQSESISCSDADAPTKSTDYGVLFGAGVDFALGSGALTLDVLYNLGLADLNDYPDDPNTVKNRNIQIMLGYAFLFGN